MGVVAHLCACAGAGTSWPETVLATIGRGDVLLYHSSLLHQGLANKASSDRPALDAVLMTDKEASWARLEQHLPVEAHASMQGLRASHAECLRDLIDDGVGDIRVPRRHDL